MISSVGTSLSACACDLDRAALMQCSMLHSVGRGDAAPNMNARQLAVSGISRLAEGVTRPRPKYATELGLLTVAVANRAYAPLVAKWKAMVQAELPQAKQFLVALDHATARACTAHGVGHFDATACIGGSDGPSKHAAGSYTSGSSTCPGCARMLPANLPSLRFHSLAAGLALGWSVLQTELDVILLPSDGMLQTIIKRQLPRFDLTTMRHAVDLLPNATERRRGTFSELTHGWLVRCSPTSAHRGYDTQPAAQPTSAHRGHRHRNACRSADVCAHTPHAA